MRNDSELNLSTHLTSALLPFSVTRVSCLNVTVGRVQTHEGRIVGRQRGRRSASHAKEKKKKRRRSRTLRWECQTMPFLANAFLK